MFSSKAGATKLLIGVVVGLIVFKVVIGLLTHSISIVAQAADSLLDLFAGVITFSAIRFASRPADAEHQYGHGKAEDIAGVGQAVLIFIAGGLIIYSAIVRIITEQYVVEQPEAGIAVMAVSVVVSIFLSRHLLRVARRTGSVALEANARNIATDVYSTSAVLAGLAILRFTGMNIIDPILALGVAVYILKVAVDTIRRPISGLLDEKLPPSQQAVIEDCLGKHSREVSGFHALRTRRAGSQNYIDLHLVMAGDISLEQAHQICDSIEVEITAVLREASVVIHAEPCDNECEQCAAICSKRRTG
ncbi:MAG: cation diffusion facilitator family transporter [Dehalococcoidia bacterium]|nr:cation diffusion facilitator family transporter [Dehalococcoidia bacterium]